MAANVGTGATIAFGTSTGFTPQVTAINGNDITRDAFRTSHLATTGWHTHIPGDLVEGGTLELEILLDPDDLDDVPLSAGAETITLTFPMSIAGGTTEASASFSGFVTGLTYGVPLEDLMTATVTIKVAGAITFTDQV